MGTELFKNQTSRRPNGRFATPEQAFLDKTKQRNLFLEYENEMLKRKLKIFEKGILDRTIIITKSIN